MHYSAFTCCLLSKVRQVQMRKNSKPEASDDRSSAIYRALRHAIMEQGLAPGAKLPEDTIGEQFGVSRTIVRHVLARLAAEGLVDLRRNHGATVATPSWDEARDTFDVRVAVEERVVSRLAGKLTKGQIEKLKAHVTAEEAAKGRNEPLSIRLASEFHILLAEMTGSAVFSRHVNELASRCGLLLALYGRPHSSDCAVTEHRDIINALIKGDSARARAVMTSHLDAVTARAVIPSAANGDRDLKKVLARYAANGRAPAKGKRTGKRAE